MCIQAKTKDDLIRDCVKLARDVKKTRGERLNETGAKCIDVATMCLHAAAEDGFHPGKQGKLGALEFLREARQWIKQALDADQKQADQKIRDVNRRLDELESAGAVADGLH